MGAGAASLNEETISEEAKGDFVVVDPIAAENYWADQIFGNIYIGGRVYLSDENVEFDQPEERDEAAVCRVDFF